MEEKPENTEFRLQRKDTPHFTKGKRIVQDDEQKAREILANLGAKGTSDDDSDLEGHEKQEEVCLQVLCDFAKLDSSPENIECAKS